MRKNRKLWFKMENTDDRRLVVVEVASPLFFEMITKGFYDVGTRCIKGLPQGARFVRSFDDPIRYPKTIFFVFQHESFDIVPDGLMIPRIAIEFSRDFNAK